MGAKYTSQAVSGYNASPPPDDGSTTSNNKITWAGIKTKLSDAVLTLAQAINSDLVTALDTSQTVASTAYTTVAGDNWKTIEASGTTTISLGDAMTMTAGYIVGVLNVGVATITVTRATGSDTLNGATKDIKLAPGAAIMVKVIAAANGYEVIAAYNVLFDETDPSKQVTFDMSGITTGTVRSVKFPDAAGTVILSNTGSFTATLTGVNATVTGTAYYSIQNGCVVLDLPGLSGTSNTTACTITGIPAAIQPSSGKTFAALISNNGTSQINYMQLSAGTITLFNNFSSTFTNTGTKGLTGGASVSYTLN